MNQLSECFMFIEKDFIILNVLFNKTIFANFP